MTVIVTGHRGFIGGKLHTKLIERKADFIAYDTSDPGPYPYDMPVFNTLDIDVIYHIGAISGIAACEENKESALTFNVENVQRWAKVALEKDARLVFTSSMAAASVTPTWYGLTKKWAEEILLYYKQKHGLKTTIIRLPNIYGPGSEYKTSVVAKMCKDAIFNKAVYIHNTGKQTRTFLHVDDVVHCLLTMEKEGFYRIANGRLGTIKHLAKDISECFNVPIKHIDVKESELGDYFRNQPRELAISQKKCFEDGLKETMDYFKEVIKPKERAS